MLRLYDLQNLQDLTQSSVNNLHEVVTPVAELLGHTRVFLPQISVSKSAQYVVELSVVPDTLPAHIVRRTNSFEIDGGAGVSDLSYSVVFHSNASIGLSDDTTQTELLQSLKRSALSAVVSHVCVLVLFNDGSCLTVMQWLG